MASNVIEQNTNRQSFAPHARKLIDSAEKITSYINEIKFFKTPLVLQCIVKSTESGTTMIVFQLDDNNFSRTLFYNEKSSFYPYNNASIQYVNATLGYRIGIFLFYLQLLLCYIMNIAHLTLDNYTDDPLRAALGIYKRFVVDKRHHNRLEFVGKTKAEQLHTAEGAMRLEMYADFLHDWSEDLVIINKYIASKPENYLNPKNPWEATYLKHLNLFFQRLQSTFEAVKDLSWTIPQIKYSKPKPNTAIQHSSINKTKKRKPAKGGYLISKKSSGKMLRKQHRTRKHHSRKQHRSRKQHHSRKQHYSRKQHHSKKRHTLKRKSKKNSTVHHKKSKSYGGVRPESRQQAIEELVKAIEEDDADKVQEIMEEYSDLTIQDVQIDESKMSNEVRDVLSHWGFLERYD